MQKKIITLDNGLRIVLMTKDVYTVNAAITVKAGMLNETDAENGISHFLEHMAFKGTKTKTAKELIDYIEILGGNTNAFTDDDRTCYTVSLPDDFWREGCNFLADVVRNSIFPEDELEKERNVIIQEYYQRNDDPCFIGYCGLMELGFEGHKLSRQVLGTLENIKRFKREDLMAYYEKHYSPNNMIFSISLPEKYNLDNIAEYISGLFNDMKQGQSQEFEHVKIAENKHDATTKPGIEQSYIYMAMPAVKIDSEWSPVYDVMLALFDGGMSTRLFQTIREKLGLTYQTNTFTNMNIASNTFGIFSIVETENEDKAIKAIKDTFATLYASISDEELQKAKNMLKYTFAVANEGTSMIKYVVNNLFYLNKDFNYEEELQKRMDVTKEQIFKLAKAMANRQFTTFIVRPEKTKE